MAFKKTTSEFIVECVIKHNNKYDYSKVNYVNANTKVTIICIQHGEFLQQPRAHLSGQGCNKCNISINWQPSSNLQQFINKSIKIHRKTYDYSKSIYNGCMKKIIIICPKHGQFKQLANSHLNGRGCPKCANNIQKTSNEFVVQARLIHGDVYDYTKLSYTSAHGKLTIICPIHGEFKQKASNHLFGKGCSKCGIKSMRKKLSNDQNEFITKLTKKHNNKYDYSNVLYNSRTSFLTIICPTHGEFTQRASEHLRGHGCSKCAGNNQLTTMK